MSHQNNQKNEPPTSETGVNLKSLVSTARSIYGDASALRQAKKTAEFVANGYRNAQQYQQLLNTFDCDELRAVLEHFPSILSKPYEPYVCADWTVAERFEQLREHFEYTKDFFGLNAADIYRPEGVQLFEFQSGDDETFTVELCQGYQSEGSMGLRLCDSQRREVYALTFHIAPLNGGSLYIGGLQGPNDRIPDRQKTIVAITRSLHGLRPKALMIEATYMLATALGINGIYGIANHAHIYQSDRYSDEKRSQVEFDYEQLWGEYQAEEATDRFMKLPEQPVRKDIASLKSKKRSMYRKRYQWLDESTGQTIDAVIGLLVENKRPEQHDLAA